MNELDPSMMRDRSAALRILDANFNRATEGLRVCEEYARFVMEERVLAERYKHLRHDLGVIFQAIPLIELLESRDTPGDVGTQITTETEYRRVELLDVAIANAKRVEQSLRALEEYGKVVAPEVAKQVEQLRYRAYDAAKVLLAATQRSERLQAAKLYVLIDGGRDEAAFVSLAQTLIESGVDVLQLRDKQLADRELLARARLLRTLTRGRTLFIMNDRPDLAALCDADGVHVGQDELTVADARRIVGPRSLIGVSTHNIQQARQAVRDGADYIGCGPTFPSTTKTFEHYPGLDFLRQVAAEISLPAFAIGGITLDNLPNVLSTGLHRIAVSGAVTSSSDVGNVILSLLSQFPQVITTSPLLHP